MLAHFRADRRRDDAAGDHLQHPRPLRRSTSPPRRWPSLAEVDNIVAVKQANPDLARDAAAARAGDRVGVYAGNDDMLLDVLELGGWGGICVASHLVGPRMARDRRVRGTRRSRRGRGASTRRCAALYKTLFITSNPIPVKAALNLLGHEVGGLRLPLVEATDGERDLIRAELKTLGLL